MGQFAIALAVLAALAPAVASAGHSRAAAMPSTAQASEAIDAAADVLPLWPSRDVAGPDAPYLTVVRPPENWGNGTAVVIAPGGAYIALAKELEGFAPAHWFASRGITAFVLTYRVGPKARLPVPLRDGARAVRLVRANAARFNLDPGRIGMMGFSAGGHLAAMTAVEGRAGRADDPDPVERQSSRPDFLVLGYPWLEGTQVEADGRSWYCRFALMQSRDPCDPKDYAGYLPVSKVTGRMPATFIYHTTDDELVPVAGSVRFFAALIANDVPAELHAFQKGRHGTGLGGSDTALSRWPDLLQEWLRIRGLLPPPAASGMRP